MTEHIKAYINERFERVKAPRRKSVTALKREMAKRLLAAARYFMRHGLSEADALKAVEKSLTNVKAPIRAVLNEERKNENAHSRIKGVVSFLAMVCLIMSPFPIVQQSKFGFVLALGLIAFGVVLFIYSSKSTPKAVDVSEICDRFEIGAISERKPKREPIPKPSVQKQPQKRRAEEEDDDEGFENDKPRGSVYSMTSRMFLFAALGAYVLAGIISAKWLICLMIFPICFSITRLAKAFTDFFKGSPEETEPPPKSRKGASR